MKRLSALIFAMLMLVGIASAAVGQSRAEQRHQREQEALAPKSVGGGETFQVSVPYDKTYDQVLNFLKRQDYLIESANRETGQIITALSGKKGWWKQTRTGIQITLFKDNDRLTTVKVAVLEYQRKRGVFAKPGDWHAPKVNVEETAKLVEQVQAILKPSHGVQ
jgi:hypothetical protein